MTSPRVRNFAGQVLRFAISTGISATISFGLPLLLHEYFGLPETSAVAIGFAAAYLGNIWLLRNFVFQSAGSWKRETLLYVLTNAAFRIAEYVGFLVLFQLAKIDYRIALLSVLGISAILKFFMYRKVFTRR